jgi:diadenosine tetraphosphate (Ap4A) HIT family hydrolase
MMELVDCVFCRIVEGSAQASIVYSDESVLAFLDIQPVNQGHVLVIPKRHASNLGKLDEETGGQLFKVAMRVVESIKRSGLKCEGANFHLADGKVAGQDVMHVHLHVIPRFKGDGVKFGYRSDYRPSREGLDDVALRLRSNMLTATSSFEVQP